MNFTTGSSINDVLSFLPCLSPTYFFLLTLSSNPWTPLYMDGTAVNFSYLIFPHEAGTWDPNYTLGVNFLDHDFL